MKHAVMIVALFVALLIAGALDFEDEQIEQNTYCTKVSIYKATKGKDGWPDFREEYQRICTQN